MAASVNKYHGYYVGRYEMSLDASGNAQSKKNETSMYNDSTANDWYGMYAKAKTYAQENASKSVVSSMIYGSQYEAMMSWMEGNGIDTTSKTPTDLSIGITSKNTTRVTASEPKDKLSNVFDLLGNSYEWTQEAINTTGHVSRGGYCDNDGSASGRSNNIPTNTYRYYSSCLTLYVK